MRILRPFSRYTKTFVICPDDSVLIAKNINRVKLSQNLMFAVENNRFDLFNYVFELLYPRPQSKDAITTINLHAEQFQLIISEGFVRECFDIAILTDNVWMLMSIKPLLQTSLDWEEVINLTMRCNSPRALIFLIKAIPRNKEITIISVSASMQSSNLRMIKILDRFRLLDAHLQFQQVVRTPLTLHRKKPSHVRGIIRYLMDRHRKYLTYIPTEIGICTSLFELRDLEVLEIARPLFTSYWQLIHHVNECAKKGMISMLRTLINWCDTLALSKEQVSKLFASHEAMITAAHARKLKTLRMILREFKPDISRLPDWVDLNTQKIIRETADTLL